MDSFSYISVILSIVLGLAITQVLLGFRGLILTRAKVKLYAPTITWAFFALVLPDIGGEKFVDLRQHFFAHRSWFFCAMLGSVVFSLLKTLALYGHLPSRIDFVFELTFGAIAIAAAVTRSEWFHKLLAPATALLFVVYIALLFSRL